MLRTVHDIYVESRVESAGPLELIRLLYQGATGAVREARQHLASGDIAARSRAISKALDILLELTVSLDRSRGGQIAIRLAQLYDYMRRRLIDANATQTDEPLAEVLGLLDTLGEAWEKLEEPAREFEAAAGPWTQTAGVGLETGRAWSL
jgi:flagellar protein FliS